MGDRYEMSFECPNCHSMIWCYYAESSGIDKVRCEDCKKEFKIVMDFKLVAKGEEKATSKNSP